MSENTMNKEAYIKVIEGNIDFLKRNLSKELFTCAYCSHIIDVMKTSINLLYPDSQDLIINGQVFLADDEEQRYNGMVYIISNLFHGKSCGIDWPSKVTMQVKPVNKRKE